MRRALATTIVLFALIWVVALFRYGPPAPVGADAPAERFSAVRARAFQEKLVAAGPTRFVGTEGNANARALIAAELKTLGWAVELQTTWSCTFHAACAEVTNVIGTLAGSAPGPHDAVLLSAHYDSVLSGPGASDDGLGTSALVETARALAAGPRPQRTVIALFADAEEPGLLGAGAFVHHPLASTIGTTVNVDSRGSRGPSQMFETSRANGWLVEVVAGAVERPVTTSLFYEIYKRMPNDTDFTLTKTIASGVNFANTAGIEHYHTPADDLASSNVGTLQHHGDNVLAMARAFAEPTARGSNADAVWFDVFAHWLVRWPEKWTTLLAVVALVAVALRAVRQRVFGRGLVVAVALVPGVLATFALGWALHAVGAIASPWVAYPLPALAALHLVAIAAAGAPLVWLVASSPRAAWAGTWLGWGALGVLTAFVAPGASYLFIVPTVAAAAASALPFAVACAVPAVVAAVLVLALQTGLYDALGLVIPAVVGIPTLLLLLTLAPLLAALPVRSAARTFLATGAGALVLGVVAMLVPKFSKESPQRVNVVLRQDDSGARTFVDPSWRVVAWGAPPSPMLEALGQVDGHARAFPWELPVPFAEVPRLPLEMPTAEARSVEENGPERRVRTRLRAPKKTTALTLLLPASRRVEVKVQGHWAMPRSGADGTFLHIHAIPDAGVDVELATADSGGPISLTVLARSAGVPAGTKATDAVRARPSDATAFQDGDQTVVAVALSL